MQRPRQALVGCTFLSSLSARENISSVLSCQYTMTQTGTSNLLCRLCRVDKHLLCGIALALSACAAVEPLGGSPVALVDAAGQSIGSVRAWQTAGGVTFHIEAAGLPHGVHGLHVHAIGRCDPPDFSTAGPHWNPAARKHGMNNPAGPHAGDLPNIEVAANGVLGTTVTLPGAFLVGDPP